MTAAAYAACLAIVGAGIAWLWYNARNSEAARIGEAAQKEAAAAERARAEALEEQRLREDQAQRMKETRRGAEILATDDDAAAAEWLRGSWGDNRRPR